MLFTMPNLARNMVCVPLILVLSAVCAAAEKTSCSSQQEAKSLSELEGVIVILFFGLMWAAAMGTVGRFRPFDTASFMRANKWAKARWRFCVAFIVCDMWPLCLLLIAHEYVAKKPRLDVNSWNIAAVFIASLSMFSIPRLLYGILAIDPLRYYTTTEWNEVNKLSLASDDVSKTSPEGVGSENHVHSEPWSIHLIPGFLHAIIPLAIAWIMLELGENGGGFLAWLGIIAMLLMYFIRPAEDSVVSDVERDTSGR